MDESIISLEPDLLVIGGGTAGACAAIAAGREGVRVALIEMGGCLGGTATAGMTVPLMSSCDADGNWLARGLNEELMRLVAARAGTPDEWRFFDMEILKLVLEELAAETGVEIAYHTMPVAVNVSGRRVESVRLQHKALSADVRPGFVIDATGDADVAAMAGVPFVAGTERGGQMMATSVRFTMANVDTLRAAHFALSRGLKRAANSECYVVSRLSAFFPDVRDFDRFRNGGCQQFYVVPSRPGEANFNVDTTTTLGGDTNPLRPRDVTRCCLDGRREAHEWVRLMKVHFPGFEKAYLAQTAPLLGIRESRRIVGRYTLTLDDVLDGRRFQDGICRNNYPVDIHLNAVKEPIREARGLEPNAPLRPTDFHEIPLRCLMPRDLDNLLVSGRAISADHAAMSCIRVQVNCRALGEAAGLAAAQMATEGATFDTLDIAPIRRRIFGEPLSAARGD